jgi:hypothetical protein
MLIRPSFHIVKDLDNIILTHIDRKRKSIRKKTLNRLFKTHAFAVGHTGKPEFEKREKI